jgi:hypothetical protein
MFAVDHSSRQAASVLDPRILSTSACVDENNSLSSFPTATGF